MVDELSRNFLGKMARKRPNRAGKSGLSNCHSEKSPAQSANARETAQSLKSALREGDSAERANKALHLKAC